MIGRCSLKLSLWRRLWLRYTHGSSGTVTPIYYDFFLSYSWFNRAARESDGLLTPHMTNLDDAELLATIDRWLSKDKRPAAFNIGPLLPFQDGTTNFSASTLEAEMRSAPPGVGDAVMSFLDKVLVSRGEESAVYICLGSTFW